MDGDSQADGTNEAQAAAPAGDAPPVELRGTTRTPIPSEAESDDDGPGDEELVGFVPV